MQTTAVVAAAAVTDFAAVVAGAVATGAAIPQVTTAAVAALGQVLARKPAAVVPAAEVLRADLVLAQGSAAAQLGPEPSPAAAVTDGAQLQDRTAEVAEVAAAAAALKAE